MQVPQMPEMVLLKTEETGGRRVGNRPKPGVRAGFKKKVMI